MEFVSYLDCVFTFMILLFMELGFIIGITMSNKYLGGLIYIIITMCGIYISYVSVGYFGKRYYEIIGVIGDIKNES